MPRTGKTRTFIWLALKAVVAGSVVVSRTAAAPVPPTPEHLGMIDGWRSVGQQMGAAAGGIPPLDKSIVDMIATADLKQNLSVVVLATYEMIDPSQIRSLDAHWANVLTASGNAMLVAKFLHLRSGLDALAGHAVEEVDEMLWLESRMSKRGCDGCNSGRGNDSEPAPGGEECDPGNSGGKNQGGD